MTINCLCFVPFLLHTYIPIVFKLWKLFTKFSIWPWFFFLFPVYSKFYCSLLLWVCNVMLWYSMCVLIVCNYSVCIGLFQLHGRIWDALSYFCLYLYVQVQVFGISFNFTFYRSFVRSFIGLIAKTGLKTTKCEWQKMMKWFRSRILFARTLIEWVYRDNICPFVFNRFFFLRFLFHVPFS